MCREPISAHPGLGPCLLDAYSLDWLVDDILGISSQIDPGIQAETLILAKPFVVTRGRPWNKYLG